jgi:hypothetical protein
MPRINASLANTTIGFVILPKEDYEFSLSGPKLINRENDRGPVYGVMYMAKVTKGPQDYLGKQVPISLFLHSPEAAGMVKRFCMAALGFQLTEAGEQEYNAQYGSTDDSIDTDEGVDSPIGELWHKIGGSTVAASVDVKQQKNDATRTQNQFNWRPI